MTPHGLQSGLCRAWFLLADPEPLLPPKASGSISSQPQGGRSYCSRSKRGTGRKLRRMLEEGRASELPVRGERKMVAGGAKDGSGGSIHSQQERGCWGGRVRKGGAAAGRQLAGSITVLSPLVQIGGDNAGALEPNLPSLPTSASSSGTLAQSLGPSELISSPGNVA